MEKEMDAVASVHRYVAQWCIVDVVYNVLPLLARSETESDFERVLYVGVVCGSAEYVSDAVRVVEEYATFAVCSNGWKGAANIDVDATISARGYCFGEAVKFVGIGGQYLWHEVAEFVGIEFA